jgi:ribA/ribD-fused uncharacterized protein
MNKKIVSFSGRYDWLSNFYLYDVTIGGYTFPSTEHAYQAFKTKVPEQFQMVRLASRYGKPSPAEAKKLGKKVTIRSDWEQIKIQVMRDIVAAKFLQNDNLAVKLIQTGDAELIEGNYWNDTFWGVCNGVGENWLGKILMEIRDVYTK